MAKRPERMTAEERLVRIRSLERHIAVLERALAVANDRAESVRHWAEEAWREVRHLQAVCTRHWNEKNDYRRAAGLEPEDATLPLARFDEESRRWVPVDITDERGRRLLANLLPHPLAIDEDGNIGVLVASQVTADGGTLEEAIDVAVSALREYAEDWFDHLRNTPNHRAQWPLALFVHLSSDEELHAWLASALRP